MKPKCANRPTVEAIVGHAGWMHGRCPHRHCVHDKCCTLQENYWQRCPQWGDAPMRCRFRNRTAVPNAEHDTRPEDERYVEAKT